MKAIIFTNYNAPIQVIELPVPHPKPNEVLVKTRAVAVNDFDWSLIRGIPGIYRLLFGLFKPKIQVPGIELAGMVEQTGGDVTQFKPGDRVYGDISGYGWGTFAEYVCVRKDAIFPMSEHMTFEQAAALPHAGMLALQALVDIGKIQKGEKILINGGGGGVGTLGVQMAKQYDAEVTGVDTAEKFETMRSAGFDFLIDYKKEDFTRSGKRYDLIVDTRTMRPPSAFKRALTEKGRYVTVGGTPLRLLHLASARIFKRDWNHHVVSLKPNKDLRYINELFESGRLKPVIDGPFKLDEAAKALQYFGEGRHKGKIVLTV